MIRLSIDRYAKLAWFIGDGVVRLDDVKEVLEKFYVDRPTPKTIWDFTGADLSEATLDQVEELVNFVKERSPRKNGRNAFVASDPFIYTLGQMYRIFAELADQTIRTKIFRTRSEAEEWLRD